MLQNVTLFVNRIFIYSSYNEIIRMSPNSIQLVSKKGGNLETDMHTERRPHEHGGRDGAMDASTRQGRTKIASKLPEARREDGTESPSLMVLRRNQPC